MIKENPFKIKSENNLKSADFLENRNCFDAAVNRLYYSLYQKTLFMQDMLNIPTTKTSKETKRTDTHNEFFEDIMGFLFFGKLIDGTEMLKLAHMNTLKYYRVKADYHKEIMSKEDVKLARSSYEICSNIIDRIIEDFD